MLKGLAQFLVCALFLCLILSACPKKFKAAMQCDHDRNSVGFWNDTRILPAVVTRIEGNEVTTRTSDKKEVQVHILHLDDKTERNGKLEVKKAYMFVYCVKCYLMHGYKPL